MHWKLLSFTVTMAVAYCHNLIIIVFGFVTGPVYGPWNNNNNNNNIIN